MNIFNKRSVQLLAAAVTGWCGCRAYDHVSSNSHIFAATLLPSQSVRLEPASSTGRPAQIMRFGFPGTDSVRFLNDYVMSYDRRNRTAHWVFEHLTKDSLQRNESVDRSKCEFQEDVDVHPYFRSLNSDYKKSGFDRGHLAAAGNHRKCQADVDQTFLLSNVAPQVGKGFNRNSWNRLEMHVRQLARKYKNVYVCTGPLYLPRLENDGKKYVKYQVIGPNHVAVPTHFFKVVVGETENAELDLESYVMPNMAIADDTPLGAFMVGVSHVC